MLVEVHTEAELSAALDWVSILGVNNRDLKTFVTDIHVTPHLLKGIPDTLRAKRCLVGERGIGSHG